jgi:hypothetical protein
MIENNIMSEKDSELLDTFANHVCFYLTFRYSGTSVFYSSSDQNSKICF